MIFMAPFTCQIVGASFSGKTSLVKSILENAENLIFPLPEKIYLLYSEFQELYTTLRGNIELIKGLPDLDPLLELPGHKLIIIDDLMSSAYNSQAISDLFTKGSHHKNCSVILLSQNLFNKGKCQRNISLNTHHLILFNNVRDSQQIRHLGQQLGNSSFFNDAYKKATLKNYGYLLCNLRADVPKNMRFMSDIVPDSGGYTTVYLPL